MSLPSLPNYRLIKPRRNCVEAFDELVLMGQSQMAWGWPRTAYHEGQWYGYWPVYEEGHELPVLILWVL